MKPSMFYHVALTDWDGGLYTYDGPNLCENGYISASLFTLHGSEQYEVLNHILVIKGRFTLTLKHVLSIQWT